MANSGNNGALKLEKVANLTAGEEEVAKIGNFVEVEVLRNSPQTEKKSTRKTESPSPEHLREQSLQILRDSVEMVKKDGVEVAISDFVSKTSGKTNVIIVLASVEYVDDDFVWIE